MGSNPIFPAVINYILGPETLTIYDSYKILSCEMEDILQNIKMNATESSLIYKLPMETMINEWKAHNLIYELGMFKDRTAHVDITDNPWYIRCIYYIAARIYDLFF